MMRTIATGFATLAFLLAPLAHAAPAPATPPPPGASCARATYIRPADGAIVTRTACVIAQSSAEVGK